MQLSPLLVQLGTSALATPKFSVEESFEVPPTLKRTKKNPLTIRAACRNCLRRYRICSIIPPWHRKDYLLLCINRGLCAGHPTEAPHATIARMLIDAISATDLPANAPPRERAIAGFLAFIERRLGVQIVREPRDRITDPLLAAPLRVARLLKDRGVIRSFYRNTSLTDEPRLIMWTAVCNEHTKHATGGASPRSEADALMAALAEGLERFLWLSKDDYFEDRTHATVEGIERYGRAIPPSRYSGYTDAQRAANPRRRIDPDSQFTWIRGHSLVGDDPVFLPAQTVGGIWSEYYTNGPDEPIIRPPITIGLATWPTQAGARCAGANEAIEREAYMIMWLNQLTFPRYSHASLRALDPELGALLDSCERYRLKLHAVKMLTDAPTHTVAVILEDESAVLPRFSIGIRGHRSLSVAVQKAASEALRARRAHRIWEKTGKRWDTSTKASTVGHRDRLYYWGAPENASRLEFLVTGKEIEAKIEAWDSDSPEEHLARIVEWCRSINLECIAVSLGKSPSNPTSLAVEMTVMPELQWTYISESTQAFGGNRWREVPALFGYPVRTEPFADEPHPFS